MEPRLENGMYIWENNPIYPEFRLYYDDRGVVVSYTSDPNEKLPYQYITISRDEYAQGRQDVRVVDGKIVTHIVSRVLCKLMPDKNEGTLCASEDMSVVITSGYDGKMTKWKHVIYEF